MTRVIMAARLDFLGRKRAENSMVLGFISLPIFTLIHVLITFVAIGSGFWLMWGFIRNNPGLIITEIFLTFTFLSSALGFLFPITRLTPALTTGVVAMLVLVPTLAAFYIFKLKASWRTVYVIGAVVSLYLKCFVLVVQAFL
jgi:hypothetical protein